MCRDFTDSHVSLASIGLTFQAVSALEGYNMESAVSSNPIPCSRPFIRDHGAAYILADTKLPVWSSAEVYSGGHSVMNDIVEAIRHTTKPITTDNMTRWMPPTTYDIQKYMWLTWPQKYSPDVADAKGWKNSVNQCLTHGKGWNFITYVAETGKNKRHCLVERAFNGVCILGSGVCKGLNDRKPKSTRDAPRPVPPPPVADSELFIAGPLLAEEAAPSTPFTPFIDPSLPIVPDVPVADSTVEEVDYSQYLNNPDFDFNSLLQYMPDCGNS
jgi:hypothetical protein